MRSTSCRLAAARIDRGERRAGAREDRRGLAALRREHGRERTGVGVERRRRVQAAIGEADAEPVVADDAVALRKLLVEGAGARLLPFALEVRDEGRAEERAAGRRRRSPRRPGGHPTRRSGSPAPSTGLSRHHPGHRMARSGHSAKMARRADSQAAAASATIVTCTRESSEGVTVRPLRDGDTATVAALFERLGEESRRRRFGGAKPRLTGSRARRPRPRRRDAARRRRASRRRPAPGRDGAARPRRRRRPRWRSRSPTRVRAAGVGRVLCSSWSLSHVPRGSASCVRRS